MRVGTVCIAHHASESRLKLITSLARISSLSVELLGNGVAEQLKSSLSTEYFELSRLRPDVLLDVCFPEHAVALQAFACWFSLYTASASIPSSTHPAWDPLLRGRVIYTLPRVLLAVTRRIFQLWRPAAKTPFQSFRDLPRQPRPTSLAIDGWSRALHAEPAGRLTDTVRILLRQRGRFQTLGR